MHIVKLIDLQEGRKALENVKTEGCMSVAMGPLSVEMGFHYVTAWHGMSPVSKYE